MPKYEITTPDGRYEITVPEGTSEQQAYEYFQKQQQPEPGVLPAVGRFARGAGRAAAGVFSDMQSLGNLTGIPLMGPRPGMGIGKRGPSVTEPVKKFADAPMPSTSEQAGWWTAQGLQALTIPERVLPLAAGTKAAKAGIKFGATKLGEVAEQLAGQQGEKTAAKEATEALPKAAGKTDPLPVGEKPRLRMKASGEIKEISPEGTERSVRNWTLRQMEKRAENARLARAQPPPLPADVQADFQKVVESLGHHGTRRLAHHLLQTAGVPPGVSHALMTRAGRRLSDLAIGAGTIGGTHAIISNERSRPPQALPPGLSAPNSSPP